MMEDLPPEIIERILSYIPVKEILFYEQCVCQRWAEFLYTPNFWIRKLKRIDITIEEEILSVLSDFDDKIQADCLYNAYLDSENNQSLWKRDEFEYIIYKVQNQRLEINDNDYKMMIRTAGVLVTRNIKCRLILNKNATNALYLILRLLAVRNSETEVYDNYGFWNFSKRNDLVRMLKDQSQWDNVTILRGSASNIDRRKIKSIPELSITDDDRDFIVSIPEYSSINVLHLKAGLVMIELTHVLERLKLPKSTRYRFNNVEPSFFCYPIPKAKSKPTRNLIISELDSIHIPWIVNILKRLKSPSHKQWLTFLSYKLDSKGTETLLQCMKEVDVLPHGVMCAPSACNTAEDFLSIQSAFNKYFPLKLNDEDLLNESAECMKVADFYWFESNKELKSSYTFNNKFVNVEEEMFGLQRNVWSKNSDRVKYYYDTE